MADTIELQKHIEDIEVLLKTCISNALDKLKLPITTLIQIDFNLNNIHINILTNQEFGKKESSYILEKVKLEIDWEPHDYDI